MAEVLAVVVTFNGSKWVHDCLGSLSNSTLPVDILVVDNKSTDNTDNLIKSNFPKVQFLQSEQNLGFGRANNIGLKKALKDGYAYVFLLNQDAWIEPDTIEILVNLHQQHPKYGIISPLHLNKEKTKLDSKFSHFICRSENLSLMSDLLLPLGQRSDIYSLDFINAAAWLISRDCLKTVGGFDPLFPHYGEDNDFINRALYYHFKVGFTPKTSIVHDREGFIKQPDRPRSFAKQYTDRLRMLKDIHLPFKKTLFLVLKEEAYYAFSALLKLDIGMFIAKLRLIIRILSQKKGIQKSRKYCTEKLTAYLT